MLNYIDDVEKVDIDEFQNPKDAFVVEHETYFRRNTCAMMMNAEPNMLKRACIFAVYSDSGAYPQYAVQYLLRFNYPRARNAKGREFFDSKTYTEIYFWINFYSILSQKLVDKTRQYFDKEKDNLPVVYKKMFEYIYGKIEEDYL